MATKFDALSGVTEVHLKYDQFDEAQRAGLEKSFAQAEYMDAFREALRRGMRIMFDGDSGRATQILRLENGQYRFYPFG